jgi:Uncharacterized protein conserved in bacteria (DUF2314)
MRVITTLGAIISLLTSANAQTNAPPDKPQWVRGSKQTEAFDRAIAPYVAKARATYPAAKKRFLAGLPRNFYFSVWIPLGENDKKTGEYHYEYVFVAVDKISSGKVYGQINNTLLALKRHHKGERIQFPESRVLNWAIVRPDGSEEGNYVGNFLDHWKPPKG